MSRANDLAAVLNDGRPRAGDVGLRQGIIVSFNQDTGASTVSVSGALLVDLPLLSSAESIEYLPGDVVVLIRMGASWAILGRLVLPGGVLAGSAVAFEAVGQVASNFAVSTTPTRVAFEDVTVPAWANRVLAYASTNLFVEHTTASAVEFLKTRVTFNGNPGADSVAAVGTAASGHPNKYGTVTGAAIFDGAVSGGSTFTVGGDVFSAVGSWTAIAANRLNLDGILIFRRA